LPEHDLGLLKDAATEAGKIAERYFQSDQQVWEKDQGQGPVTEADLEIDQMLKSRLLAARPDYGWLSEESLDSEARLAHERVFIVDPIDGTRAFVHGHKTFAHALAVVERGQVVTGVVYLPLRGFMYHATLGSGAFLNGQKLSHSGRETVVGARVLTAKAPMEPENWPGGVPNIERHFRSSLAYRMCLVAEGRFDGMLTLRDAWEWDIAAGALICQESGVTVTDRHNKPLQFNNPRPQQTGVLAAAPAVHGDFLAHLAV